MTDFPTLSYTSTTEIPNLPYTWGLTKISFRAEPTHIDHYRDYLAHLGVFSHENEGSVKGLRFIAALTTTYILDYL